MKYAIKYLKIKYDTDTYLLVPKQLVKGDFKDRFIFEVNGKEIPYINNANQNGYYVIADALSIDELRHQYEVSEDDMSDEEFAKGVIEALNESDRSIRDLNNIISDFFLDIEYSILENNEKDKKLILKSSSIKDRTFDII